MRSRILAVALGLTISVALVAAPVMAHYADWPPSTYSTSIATGFTWRTVGDSVSARSFMTWNTTSAANMRHMATHDTNRFTHDARDMSDNLNATGTYITDLPNPYYDKDDDNGNRQWEEAEITADSTSFPVANIQYVSQVFFSHWYAGCQGSCWTWDSGGGLIAQTAQISRPGCPVICDRWDAAQGLADKPMGSNAYPAKSAPASLTSAPELELQAAGADDETVAVIPDLGRGVQRYAISARALAASVARRGASLGIATFSRPLGGADVRELARIGLVISAVEGVATAADGRVWTIGTAYGETAFAQMEELAAELGLKLQGVVSAEITISDADRLRLVQDDPRVFLVDLSIEQVRRSTGLRDVVQNDLYWNLAGWE